MFDKLKQGAEMVKMANEARKLQKMMDSEEVVIEENDIRVVITASQKFKEFSIKGVSNPTVLTILNKAVEKSQKVAAEKMQEMSGGLQGLMKGLMGNGN